MHFHPELLRRATFQRTTMDSDREPQSPEQLAVHQKGTPPVEPRTDCCHHRRLLGVPQTHQMLLVMLQTDCYLFHPLVA